jgi:hypothetical protein
VRAWHHSGGDGRAQPVTCAPSLNTLPFAWPGPEFLGRNGGVLFFLHSTHRKAPASSRTPHSNASPRASPSTTTAQSPVRLVSDHCHQARPSPSTSRSRGPAHPRDPRPHDPARHDGGAQPAQSLEPSNSLSSAWHYVQALEHRPMATADVVRAPATHGGSPRRRRAAIGPSGVPLALGGHNSGQSCSKPASVGDTSSLAANASSHRTTRSNSASLSFCIACGQAHVWCQCSEPPTSMVVVAVAEPPTYPKPQAQIEQPARRRNSWTPCDAGDVELTSMGN